MITRQKLGADALGTKTLLTLTNDDLDRLKPKPALGVQTGALINFETNERLVVIGIRESMEQTDLNIPRYSFTIAQALDFASLLVTLAHKAATAQREAPPSDKN